MQIERVSVLGLFDRFDHELRFSSEEPITIMIGPNGFGKTMILRLLNVLFSQPVFTLSRYPFRKLIVNFDNNSKIEVSRKFDKDQNIPKLKLVFRERNKIIDSLEPQTLVSSDDLSIPLSSIEDIIPELDQIDRREWRDLSTGSILDFDGVVEKYGSRLPWDSKVPEVTKPEWLLEIRKAIPVRYIDTERLTLFPSASRRPHGMWHSSKFRMTRTVRRYSEELGERVQKTLSEYGSRSQSLDRSFPMRLVEEPPKTHITIEQLRQELSAVEATRAKLVEAGLIAHEDQGPVAPSIEAIDESRRGVLAVYAQDTKEKLSIFDDLYLRIDALKRISDERLLYKHISVGPKGLSVLNTDDSTLDLEMLSSGEQHELVILYELLFRVKNNSFVLIDEPELSLHVDWQDKFLEDLLQMAKISNFRVLLATHSPQIIGDNWHLTVELKGPKL
ncbi:MAG: AAA family ATPase [Gammaproteobacteria bacterium]|nr:AAA family ATPase [Gammaproteobacteria bacterium]